MVQWNCAEKRVENVSLAIFQPQWRKSISWATRITSCFLLGLFILDVSQNEGFIFVSFLGRIVFMLGEVSPKWFKFQATIFPFRIAHLHFLRSHRWRTIWALRLHGQSWTRRFSLPAWRLLALHGWSTWGQSSEVFLGPSEGTKTLFDQKNWVYPLATTPFGINGNWNENCIFRTPYCKTFMNYV